MTKHLFRPCGGGFSKTLAFAFSALVALALSIAISAPATALAANAGGAGESGGNVVTLSRIAGDDADQTAAAISQAGFESSECAILARMDDFADALGASGLAGTLGCPILLTSTSGLSEAAAEELERLGAETVFIIGGPGAISEQLETDLEAIGITDHSRIYGDYAWDTSLKCAVGIEKLNGNEQSEAIVAMSSNFQDALSISTFAYKYHVPLILQDDAAQLTEDAVAYIEDTTGTIYVPGGPGAVPEKSVEDVFTGRTIQRLYGNDGYDTSNQIATYMTDEGLLSASAVAIASGAQAAHGVDALAGAALLGKQGGVMLLANGNSRMEDENYVTIDAGEDSEKTPSYLLAHKNDVIHAAMLGGEVVAPTAFFDKVEQILGYVAPDPDPDPDPETYDLPKQGWVLSPNTFVYDGNAKTPTITAPNNLEEGADYKVAYTNIKNAGTATVTITGTGNYTGTVELEFTIEKADPTFSETLTTTATAGQTLASVELPQLPEGFDGTLAWNNESMSVGTQGGAIQATATYTPKDTANYNVVEVDVLVTVKVEAGKYWLAAAQATNPEDEAGILKSQLQIDEDMAVLHGTKQQTSAGKNKAAVELEYKNYMDGKNAAGEAQEVRLYTKWNLSDAGDGANKWVEFRIIQVGEHFNDSADATSGDGSAVTFMATHALPTKQQMNTTETNVGGWIESGMYDIMNDADGYVKTGLSDLAPSVKAVAKASTGGSRTSWEEGKTSTDTFWLVSYSELFGITKVITDTYNYGNYKAEGSQYAWCASQSLNPTSENTVFAGMSNARDNTSLTAWWMRSPSTDPTSVEASSSCFGELYQGNPTYSDAANKLRAVVPAFCF